ncbi:sensor histidine kinase [Ferrovibrio xuzhouensis]|uniref:histidine kinase n=1 Tax=Ferrovibrio xuzhouensis TaxID=1576914 RepID=A0ABV7VJ56_9PROT
MKPRSLALQLSLRLLLAAVLVGVAETLFIVWRYFGLDVFTDAGWTRIVEEVGEHVARPVVPMILVTGIVAILVARRAVRPLGRIAALARQIDWHRGGQRLPEEGLPAEAAELVTAVNTALGRLDRVLAELRHFTADVAHDLRTPLAAMTLDLDGVPEPVHGRLAAQIAAMAGRVEQLLALAQVEAAAVSLDQAVDLVAVARETITRLVPLALESDHLLGLEIEAPQPARGHPGAVAMILQNLIDNAIRHTPAGTPIDVQVGPGPVLTVTDHGPGIPSAIRAALAERFTPGAGQGAGTGLGLSVVARTVAALDGELDIAEGQPAGTVVTVRLQPAS